MLKMEDGSIMVKRSCKYSPQMHGQRGQVVADHGGLYRQVRNAQPSDSGQRWFTKHYCSWKLQGTGTVERKHPASLVWPGMMMKCW